MLAGLLAVLGGVAVFLLREVLATVFIAVTVAYVLLPVRARLVRRGLSDRAASAVAATLAFLVAVALVAPLVIALYTRRQALFDRLAALPETVTVDLGVLSYVIDVEEVLLTAQDALTALAIDVARATPVLALKAVLFVFVVFALLLKPGAVRTGFLQLVPPPYHDVLFSLHDRIRKTLYAIYVLQAATAAGTFLIALVVFLALGYVNAFAYAVIAGILQFIPIVGPSILVVGLAAFDLSFGDPSRAVLVLVFGLTLIGFLPDALIRPKLAERTAALPGSVYFVGFTGGVLSVGVVGFIAGPLIVALLIEVVTLLSVR